MKKLIYSFLFVIFFIGFSKNSYSFFKKDSTKLYYVDYSSILDGYLKTEKYNNTLQNLRNKLEEKYNIDLEDRKDKSKEKKKAVETYKNVRSKLTDEIARDIDIAVSFYGQTENCNMILDKDIILYGANKGKDVSKYIIDFLNDVYFRNLKIKKENKLKNDVFPRA